MRGIEFSRLPGPAKLLVVGTCLLGAATLTAGLYAPLPRDLLVTALYVSLAFWAASRRVQIHPNIATMSIGFLFVFAALFQCGTTAAIIAAVLNAVAGLVFRPADGWRQSAIWTAYSAGSLAVAAWAAGMLYAWLAPAGGSVQLSASLLPAAAAVMTYYLVSVSSVGLVPVLLKQGLPSPKWWLELLWLAPVYYAGGGAALALNAAYQQFGAGVFILSLPLIYAVHRSYKVRADQLQAELRHLLSIVQAFSTAIDVKDRGTHLHVRRVQMLAVEVAHRVGLRGRELDAVEKGAVLHDIGKIAIPDHVLRKDGRLTAEEFGLVREHSAIGEAILKPIDFGVDVASIVRHHHEKLDGSGYPDGLLGDAIPLGARVLGVIDAYDALISDRPYRKAWSGEQAIAYLSAHAGTGFDRAVVDALVEALSSGVLSETLESQTACELHPFSARLARAHAESATRAPAPAEPRQALLAALAARFSGLCQACVTYQVDGRNGEVDAVAAYGEAAGWFAHVRLPLGSGATGLAAQSGRPLTHCPAAEDFASLSAGTPEALARSVVHALPIRTPPGHVVGVLSLYTAPEVALSDTLLEEAAAATAATGRRLELAASLEMVEAAQEDVPLEYATFLAVLRRGVEQARLGNGRLLLAMLGARAHDGGPGGGPWLRLAAQELRLLGRGDVHVLAREAAGELLALYGPAGDLPAEGRFRRLRDRLDRECSPAPGAPLTGLALGFARYPDDGETVQDLIIAAATRMSGEPQVSCVAPDSSALSISA